MATIKLTIVGRYEAEEEGYGDCNGDVKKMAALDQGSFDNGDVSLADVLDWIEARNLTVKFEAE